MPNPVLTGQDEASIIDSQRKMKLPIEVNRYCPYCRKQTKQKVGTARQKSRSTAHPLSRWSNARVKARNLKRGSGNKGRFSKPPVGKWKRKSKSTKRITIMYTCKECKKSKGIKKAIRTARLEIGEKVAK
jgi:large subunit ribosomal protein L44e